MYNEYDTWKQIFLKYALRAIYRKVVIDELIFVVWMLKS